MNPGIFPWPMGAGFQGGGGAILKSAKLTGTGKFQVPDKAIYGLIRVMLVGAGGGGGGGWTPGANTSGGGGVGGGAGQEHILDLTANPGDTFDYSCGAGGTGGGAGSNGNVGGDTSFGPIKANGGGAGLGATSASAVSVPTAGFSYLGFVTTAAQTGATGGGGGVVSSLFAYKDGTFYTDWNGYGPSCKASYANVPGLNVSGGGAHTSSPYVGGGGLAGVIPPDMIAYQTGSGSFGGNGGTGGSAGQAGYDAVAPGAGGGGGGGGSNTGAGGAGGKGGDGAIWVYWWEKA